MPKNGRRRRNILMLLAVLVLLAAPYGVSWAQTTTTSSAPTTSTSSTSTSTTSSSTTSTTTAAATTTTTLPICIPGDTPAPVVGVNCQLPGLECFTQNPPPTCPPQAPLPDGAITVGITSTSDAQGSRGGVDPPSARVNLTG